MSANVQLKTIEWNESGVRIIDQTRLPIELLYEDITEIEQMYSAIKILKIRGAPALGIAAAYGLYLGIKDFSENKSVAEFLEVLDEKSDYIGSSRPTAVNLMWALDRMKKKAHSLAKRSLPIERIKELLLEEAHTIEDEDVRSCKAIGEHGFEILKQYNTLLTHCNAGGFATAAFGTALSPIYTGHKKGKTFRVYVDETRPLLQGSRITAFELHQAGIPVTLICDNMAAWVMSQGKIDAVIVGADRIASNGDTANKIGTYSLAVIAKAHDVPFYVAAPASTFDLHLKNGKLIPIEERPKSEIIGFWGRQSGPDTVDVYNPAFDVTPYKLIDAIITEKGVIEPPFKQNIARILRTQ